MPSVLETLTQGAAPSGATTAQATQQSLPAWYTQLVQNMAGRGLDIAGRGYTPYEGARVAGFNADQNAGFQAVRDTAAAGAPARGEAMGMVRGAPGAVAGPAQDWTSNWQRYMSPYTSSVVDEIGRVGNRNFTENLMPAATSAFAGAGQFGSTRNAEILGRTMRDVQADITGQQSRALESGYGTGAGIFANDANRQQQQGALQAQTGINAGQTMGALGQMGMAQGLTNASALMGIGNTQQTQAQRGLDTAYQDWQGAQNFDWNNLSNLRNSISGMQLPAGATSASNAPVGGYGTSPLGWLTALLGMSQGG